MHKVVLLSVLLAAPAFTGCFGDEPGPSLGRYELQADGGGGEHAMHGGGAFAGTIELFHFNSSRTHAFEYHSTPVGLHFTWSLSSGSLRVRLLDGNFNEVLNTTTRGNRGEFKEAIEGSHGTWRLNVTGMDATGTLTIATGSPASLGLSQSEPIVVNETYTFDTSSEDHTWDSATGNVTVTLVATAAAGTLTIKFLDGMAEPLPPIVVEGPANVDQTVGLQGAVGTWTITIQRELFAGSLELRIEGAGA